MFINDNLFFSESADSSSSDDESRVEASASASKYQYQSNDAQNNNDRSPTRFPIPSTSTGITSNGSLFRVAQMPDSDDDPTPQNSPPSSIRNIVPIKMNGSSHSFNSPTVYSSGVDDEQPNDTRHTRRVTSYHYSNLSSHSSSRLSNSSSDDDDGSSDDSSVPFRGNQTQSSSHLFTRIELTPIASNSRDLKHCEYTPDSGISMNPSGSSSKPMADGMGSSANRNYGGCSSRTLSNLKGDNDSMSTSMKMFQQSVTRIRRNFRNIGEASFSEDSD